MKNIFYEFINMHNIYNKKVYDYYIKHSDSFDYYNEDFLRNFIRCNYFINSFGILKEIRPYVPNIVDDKTTLVNIHEYVHTLLTYDMLNKRFKLDDDCEILPIFYEKLFVLESDNEGLIEYEEFLDKAALESNEKRYIMAVKMFDELFNNYHNNGINDMKIKTKSLIKNYNKFYCTST